MTETVNTIRHRSTPCLRCPERDDGCSVGTIRNMGGIPFSVLMCTRYEGGRTFTVRRHAREITRVIKVTHN